MALTQAQRALLERARSVGAGQQSVTLTDRHCTFLAAIIVRDLGLLESFPDFSRDLPSFFEVVDPVSLSLPSDGFLEIFERVVALEPNADTYFSCLAALLKSRLKYERILQTQPIPTLDQVGPRGLLQYGSLDTKALAGFLFWRKWMFDIDNRAGQETGYLFEPIIAHAIGGVPVSASRSPIKRRTDSSAGRQVDCIREGRAYEIKLRVTIAASGQGRWREEVEFPGDCRASAFTPVLIVLDPTLNPKLHELSAAFLAAQGEVHVGNDAWNHLRVVAGPAMGRFLEIYVHQPLQELLTAAPSEPGGLPDISLRMTPTQLRVEVGGSAFSIKRSPSAAESAGGDPIPEDADEQAGGP